MKNKFDPCDDDMWQEESKKRVKSYPIIIYRLGS